MEYSTKKILWTEETIVHLSLWDVAGQDYFANMSRLFYRGASGAIVVFDCTNQGSFNQALKWKQDFDMKAQEILPVILFANKVC